MRKGFRPLDLTIKRTVVSARHWKYTKGIYMHLIRYFSIDWTPINFQERHSHNC